MSKSKTTGSKKTTTKKVGASKKPKVDTKAAVAAAQAKDAAANAHAVNPDLVPLTQLDKAKTPGSKRLPGNKNPSGLDAAAQVLTASGGPMRCKDIVQTMLDKGLWQTQGKTPAATMYSAILREITTKGDKSRFEKTDRGLFQIRKGA